MLLEVIAICDDIQGSVSGSAECLPSRGLFFCYIDILDLLCSVDFSDGRSWDLLSEQSGSGMLAVATAVALAVSVFSPSAAFCGQQDDVGFLSAEIRPARPLFGEECVLTVRFRLPRGARASVPAARFGPELYVKSLQLESGPGEAEHKMVFHLRCLKAGSIRISEFEIPWQGKAGRGGNLRVPAMEVAVRSRLPETHEGRLARLIKDVHGPMRRLETVPSLWILLTLIVYLAVMLFLVSGSRMRKQRAMPLMAGQGGPDDDLRALLLRLLERGSRISANVFYTELASALRRSLGAFAGLPIECMTPAVNLRRAELSDAGESEALRRLAELLLKADRIRFGSESVTDTEMSCHVEAAVAIHEELLELSRTPENDLETLR